MLIWICNIPTPYNREVIISLQNLLRGTLICLSTPRAKSLRHKHGVHPWPGAPDGNTDIQSDFSSVVSSDREGLAGSQQDAPRAGPPGLLNEMGA